MLNPPIVHELEPVACIGGGSLVNADLKDALSLCSTVVAVDGGLMAAQAHGCDISAVVGDMDSVTEAALATVPPALVHKIEEQDSTDFEKALSRIAAPVVVAVGFTGGRLDHQLAVLHGMMRYPERPCVLLGGSECTFLLPRALTLDLGQGDVVSLFPLASVACRSTGLRWEIDGLDFAPGRVIGTSNEAMGQVHLEAFAPAMIATVPRAAFSRVVAALAALEADARWPVHAG